MIIYFRVPEFLEKADLVKKFRFLANPEKPIMSVSKGVQAERKFTRGVMSRASYTMTRKPTTIKRGGSRLSSKATEKGSGKVSTNRDIFRRK